MSETSPKLIDWIEQTTGKHEFYIEQLRKEASDRNYYRVKSEEISYVVMENTKNPESAANFLYASKLLKSSHVSVPEIYAFSEDLNFLLIEDLGNDVLDTNIILSSDEILDGALKELRKIYNVPLDVLKTHDQEVLLNQTSNFFSIFEYKNIHLDSDDQEKLNQLRHDLVGSLISQEYVPCHTDFERRNLLAFREKIYVIDFQDLCVGPIGIDLASLVYEHQFDYEQEEIRVAIEIHALESRLNHPETLIKDIHTALAHRSMRIIGTFIGYFKEGKLLNRQKDIDLFIGRLIFALKELKILENYKFLEKLL